MISIISPDSVVEIDNALGGGPIHKIPIGVVDERRRISHTFEAQSIDMLYTLDEAKSKLQQLIEDYESKYFGENSRWPGDRAKQALIYSETEGIPYSKGQIESLRRTAQHVGMEFTLKPIAYKNYPEDIFNK